MQYPVADLKTFIGHKLCKVIGDDLKAKESHTSEVCHSLIIKELPGIWKTYQRPHCFAAMGEGFFI
jgi:hypothetical protein